jgi:hypothetical protein
MGFQAGASKVYLKNDMWLANNIRFDNPSDEDRYVTEELERFLGKESIKSNDGKLEHLTEKILERNRANETQDLGNIHRRFACILKDKGLAETNSWKQMDIMKRCISFYDKSINVYPELGYEYNFGVIKYNLGYNTSNPELRLKAIEEISLSTVNDLNKTKINQILLIVKDFNKDGIDFSIHKNSIKASIDTAVSEELDQIAEEIKTFL